MEQDCKVALRSSPEVLSFSILEFLPERPDWGEAVREQMLDHSWMLKSHTIYVAPSALRTQVLSSKESSSHLTQMKTQNLRCKEMAISCQLLALLIRLTFGKVPGVCAPRAPPPPSFPHHNIPSAIATTGLGSPGQPNVKGQLLLSYTASHCLLPQLSHRLA